jgi:hypothetical protein
MSFVSDIRLGKSGEAYVIDLFNSGGVSIQANEDKKKFSYYDAIFSLDGSIYTAEIKYDIYAYKSGNIAIEFYNPKSNKPSGISITKSDFWIEVLTNPLRAYITRTDHLKHLIEHHPPKRIIHKAGDGNASLYLYETSFLTQNILVELKQEDLKDLLKVMVNGYIPCKDLLNS